LYKNLIITLVIGSDRIELDLFEHKVICFEFYLHK
jgi:hypothetical protein